MDLTGLPPVAWDRGGSLILSVGVGGVEVVVGI